MILAAHSDAAYLNVSKARSRGGAHIMLSEDIPVPTFNGPVLTISQIIIAGLYICAKEMVPLHNSLVNMGWPQPKSPIQTDNTTALGVANKTIITKKMKFMDMRLWWLRCREFQGQFRYYWGPGPTTMQIPYQSSSRHLSRIQKTHRRRLILLYFTVLHQNYSTHFAHCKLQGCVERQRLLT